MTFKKKADAKYVSSFLDNFTIFISLARESKTLMLEMTLTE